MMNLSREISNVRCLHRGWKWNAGAPSSFGNGTAFASGREAFLSLLEHLKLGVNDRVLLPSYVPEGLYAPVQHRGCKIVLYPVGLDLDPNWDALVALLNSHKPRLACFIHFY